MSAFDELSLDSTLLRAVSDMGFASPMPVQQQAIPLALDRRDLLVRAPTGTGKTAAFGLPVLHRLLAAPGRRPRALILAPTRELARQVHAHIESLARHTPLRGLCIVGGEETRAQEDALRRGADWLVATPGRLLAHLRRTYMDLGALEMFVLDEADRLMEIGFLPELQEIVGYLPARRQTMLFSATLPSAMAGLARELLDNPARLDIGETAPPAPVAEEFWPVAARQKFDLLVELVRRRGIEGMLVFARTRQRADALVRKLVAAGHRADVLHAERTMDERRRALAAFREGECDLLVATDLAARGLDIAGIRWVLNYDVPTNPEAYIHRAGRTGRAGLSGTVLTLMAPTEEVHVAAIEQFTATRRPPSRLEDFAYITERQSGPAPRNRRHKPAAFNTRPLGDGKKESPFTRTGKVRPAYEIPDPEKEARKKRKRRSRIKKRLPHEK